MGSFAGWAAPGAAGSPPWEPLVQKFDLFCSKLAASVLLPLGVHPNAESVFPLRIAFFVSGPVVTLVEEARELGQSSVPSGFISRCPGVFGPIRHSCETFFVGRQKDPLGCFASALRKPPRHRSLLFVLGAFAGESAHGFNPGNDLIDAGKARGRGIGFGLGGGQMGFFQPGISAPGDDQVVANSGGLGADEVSDAFPAQPEPVHQHPLGVRGAPQSLVHDGRHPATVPTRNYALLHVCAQIRQNLKAMPVTSDQGFAWTQQKLSSCMRGGLRRFH